MRDIRFRGKRVDNGEWVYGYYLADEQHNKLRHYIWTREFCGTGIANDLIDVDPETVGQFTGRKDVGIDRLFEHDIVDITVFSPFRTSEGGSKPMFTRRCVVEYRQGQLCFVESYKTSYEMEWNACIYIKDVNVHKIGNATDNPDLLKEAK